MNSADKFYVPSEEESDFDVNPNQNNLDNNNQPISLIEKKKNTDNDPQEIVDIPSNPDIISRIQQLKFEINSRKTKFEAEFDDLKRSNQGKFNTIKQNHITKEQTLSNSYDLEYRNLVWSISLKHLQRGCFTENLGPLFQQAINDEEYRLNNKIISLQQECQEDLENYKESLPKNPVKQIQFKRTIDNYFMDPIEMAQFIYSKMYNIPNNNEINERETRRIDEIIEKLRQQINFLSTIQVTEKKTKLPEPMIDYPRKQHQNPRAKKQEKYRETIRSHEKACNQLQKSVNETGRYLRRIQDNAMIENEIKETDKFMDDLKQNKWFKDVFPHVDQRPKKAKKS